MPDLYQNIKQANSQFIPRFIGSNYETLKEAADTLDTRYRQNRDLSDKIAIATAQEQYLKQDEPIKGRLLQNINSTIDEVAGSDANFENSSAIISKAARDYATDPQRLAALKNYQEVERHRQAVNELRLKGENVLDFSPITNFKGTVDPETQEINYFRPDAEKQLNYDDQKHKFFDQITADSSNKGLTSYDQEGLYGWLKDEQNTGISEGKITGYIADAFKRYKTTPEGIQEFRKLTQLDGLTPDQANQAIELSLKAVGRERIFNQKQADYKQDALAVYMAKQQMEDEANNILDRGRTQFFQNPSLPPNPLEDINFDKDGSVKKPVRLVQPPKGTPLLAPLALPNQNQEDVTESTKTFIQGIKDTNQRDVEFIGKQFGEDFGNQYNLNNLSDKAVADLHNSAYSSMKSISANPIRPSNDVLDELSQNVINSIGERSIYILDNKGKPIQGGTYQSAMEDLGLVNDPWFSTDKEITEGGQKATGQLKVTGVQPFNPYNDSLAGGFTATIVDGKGQPRTVLISADQGQTNIFTRSQAMSKAKMTGQKQVLDSSASPDGKIYEAVPLLNKNTGQYDVYVRKYEADGTPVPFLDQNDNQVGYVTADDIIEMDIDYLQRSKLLRSKLANKKPSSVE